jgi:DNA invertase Pin-like site-specific DNA recombinase
MSEKMTGQPKPNSAAIYLRKSSDEDNPSRADQLFDCEKRAEDLGLDVAAIYKEEDGVSASHIKNHHRPEFERCLEDLGTEFETLVVWKLDRWTRKGAAEAAHLCDVIGAKPGTRLVDSKNIDSAIAGIENSRLAIIIYAEQSRTEMVVLQERLLRGKEAQRRRGEYLGGRVPFGLAAVRSLDKDVSTYLVLDPEAAALIKQAARLILEGASTTEICRKWNSEGHVTNTKGAWQLATLLRMMRMPHLIGLRRYTITDEHGNKTEDYVRDEDGEPKVVTEPILDTATFRRVGEVLTSRKRTNRTTRKGNGGGTKSSLLSGLLRCAGCGSSIVHQTKSQKKKDGKCFTQYYDCSICKPRNAVPAHLVEDYISRTVVSIIGSLTPDSPIAEEIGRRWSLQYKSSDITHRNEIEEKAGELTDRLKKLQKDHYVKGVVSDDDFEEYEADIMAKLVPLEAELATLPVVTYNTNHLEDLIACEGDEDEIAEGSPWAELDHHVRRSIIKCVVDHVDVEAGVPRKPGENVEGRCDIVVVKAEDAAAMAGRSDYIKRTGLTYKAKLANA